MKTLYVLASPRSERSKSNLLGKIAAEAVGGEVEILDLTKTDVPFLTEAVIALNYGFGSREALSPEDRKIADAQDSFVSQLKSADRLVIAAPLWNFGVPAVLKAWFDLICKVGHTFKIENGAYVGLAKNVRSATVVSARGGTYAGTAYEPYDLLPRTVNGLLGFIGVENVRNYFLEGVNSKTAETIDAEIAALSATIRKEATA